MRVGYVFDCVFQNERFNRFLWFLASIINSNGTLGKCYLFSCGYKNLWDIGIYLKPHFYENCKKIRNPTTDFSITSLHEKNSGETVRRFCTIIQSIFCAQSGAGISLNFLEIVRWESVTQGLFRPYLKAFVPPFLPTRLTAPGSPRMEHFQLEISSKCDIQAENSSTLCKYGI